MSGTQLLIPPAVAKGRRIETVTISCGERPPLTDVCAGRTVAQVRQEVKAFLDVPDGAVAILNDGRSVPAGEEAVTLVQPGSLEFVARAGQKG